MRLKILIEDIEYRDALIETLSTSEKNVYIELLDSITEECFACGTILLTDIEEEKILKVAGVENASRIVVLTDCIRDVLKPEEREQNCVKRIFKYQSAYNIISKIAELNSRINGSIGSQLISTSKYLVCGDSTDQCSIFSNILARQIKFRHGGAIMVVSLSYINSHPISEEKDCSSFARLMYMRNIARKPEPDMHMYTDSYGITYLKLPVGNNPLAYMDAESIVSLCSYLCSENIETLIMDIGSEFSTRNQKLLKFADDILIVNHGGRSTDWNTFPSLQKNDIKQKITAFSDVDVELNLDDFLREKYGVLIENDETENDSKTIRKRDRQTRRRG